LFQLKEQKYSKKKKENIQHPTSNKKKENISNKKIKKNPIRKNKIFQLEKERYFQSELEIEKWQKYRVYHIEMD
jgi:hypothetical protein